MCGMSCTGRETVYHADEGWCEMKVTEALVLASHDSLSHGSVRSRTILQAGSGPELQGGKRGFMHRLSST